MPNYSKIPSFLKGSNRWLVWKYGTTPNSKGKLPKLPKDLVTGLDTDRANAAQYSFSECAAATGFDGLGFLSVGNIIGVDFDNCYTDGIIEPSVKAILDRLNSYTEISPSGHGIRVWLRGKALHAPVDAQNPLGQNLLVVKRGIEIYPHAPNANYLTVTGNRLDQYPAEMRDVPGEDISWLYAEAIRESINTGPNPTLRLTRLQRFNLLSLGSWKDLHSSQSEADLEYCCFLMEAHSGNQQLVDADLRRSKLFRSKWDERHGQGTYGQMTLQLAFANWQKDPQAGKRKDSQVPHTPLVVEDVNDLRHREIPERESVFTGPDGRAVITMQSINQTFAFRGVGKTMFELGRAIAAAQGQKFLCWDCTKPRRVLYIEGEMPAKELQDRVNVLLKYHELPAGMLKLVHIDAQPGWTISSIATDAGRKLVEQAIEDHGPEILMLDSISTLANIGANEEENWLEINEWEKYLRSKYKLCLHVLTHAGKTGLQRGHSKSEDPFDTSIQLNHPEDYLITDGLKARLHFDKTRGVSGSGFGTLEIELRDGEWVWVFEEENLEKRIAELLTADPKRSARAIAKELGCSPSYVSRLIRLGVNKECEQDLPLDSI